MITDFETFYDDIKEISNRNLITVPKKLMDFCGFKAGDKVKVMIRKQTDEDLN